MNFKSIAFRQNRLFYQLFQGSKNNKSLLASQLGINNMAAGNRKDSFIRSSSVFTGTYTAAGTYTDVISKAKPLTVKSKYISQDILADMNSGKYVISRHGNIVECNGKRFRLDQIPPIDGTDLKEVKAKNNVMDFGSNNYFKYISADGKEHLLYASELGTIGSITSDDIRVGGAPHDETLQRYAFFWRYLMAKDTVFIGLYFTDEEIKAYLDEAGIKKGFFTVKMGDREATSFRTEGKYCNEVQTKERYDERYASFTSSPSLFYDYAPGDVFKVGGKEYVLSESKTLDIPYGEDIYDIEYPKNYSYGKRIN